MYPTAGRAPYGLWLALEAMAQDVAGPGVSSRRIPGCACVCCIEGTDVSSHDEANIESAGVWLDVAPCLDSPEH